MAVAHWTKGRCPQMSRSERGVAAGGSGRTTADGVASLCRYCGQEGRALEREPLLNRPRRQRWNGQRLDRLGTTNHARFPGGDTSLAVEGLRVPPVGLGEIEEPGI